MKSLSERIAERAYTKRRCAPHSNRAVVLALRADIQQALDDGWSVLAIYQTLADESSVTFSYQTFRRYVNQIHLGKTKESDHKPRTPRRVGSNTASGPGGFTFNAAPKKEDIL